MLHRGYCEQKSFSQVEMGWCVDWDLFARILPEIFQVTPSAIKILNLTRLLTSHSFFYGPELNPIWNFSFTVTPLKSLKTEQYVGGICGCFFDISSWPAFYYHNIYSTFIEHHENAEYQLLTPLQISTSFRRFREALFKADAESIVSANVEDPLTLGLRHFCNMLDSETKSKRKQIFFGNISVFSFFCKDASQYLPRKRAWYCIFVFFL